MKTNDVSFEAIVNDHIVRKRLGMESHYWFFHIYFPHFITYPTAPFHKEIFAMTEAIDIGISVVIAFRGSGKSTIMTLSYPIWAMLGKQHKKFILIVSQTQQQSRLILTNIKQELESNELLLEDFGPFSEESDEWRINSLVIPRYGCRISAVSVGESIRGLRHREQRPDLIIIDDVEDLQSVRTQESRDQTYGWFNGEIIPAGDKTTKSVVVGNMLHEDSFIMRLKRDIEEERLDGIFCAHPIIDKNDKPTWPGKYPNMEAIDEEKRRVGNDIAWQREYLLRIVPDDYRVVAPNWIHYYDELPAHGSKEFRHTYTGVDLAISQKESADNTAAVTGRWYGDYEDMEIFLLPNPLNEKLTFPQTVEKLKTLSFSVGKGQPTTLLIESVGYQDSMIQQLNLFGIDAVSVKIDSDKRSRLAMTSHLIQSGAIKFPRHGAEQLIAQLTGFGIEKHDDLADAFSLLINYIVRNNKPGIDFFFV